MKNSIKSTTTLETIVSSQTKILETLVSNQTILSQNQQILTILVKNALGNKVSKEAKANEPKVQAEEKKPASKKQASKPAKVSKKPSKQKIFIVHLSETDKKAFKEANKLNKVKLHLPKSASKKAYLVKADTHKALFVYEQDKETKIPCKVEFDSKKSSYYQIQYKD